MAVIKSLPATKSLSNQLNYLVKEGKTIEELKEGINCTTDNVEKEFNVVKHLHKKTEGKQYYHLTQAFSPEDNISPEKAHLLGKEWIENNIKGHQVYMVTHIDKNHIHNHFVINSVNIDNGLKLQISPYKLLAMKRDSNAICERENLSKINLEPNKGVSKTDSEYRLEKKGVTPWKDELRQCIDFGRNQTKSIEELKEYLKEHFNIEIRETKNSISYKHPEQNKSVRGNKLGGDYTKEGLLNEYNIRQIKSNERSRAEGSSIKYRGVTSLDNEFERRADSIKQQIDKDNRLNRERESKSQEQREGNGTEKQGINRENNSSIQANDKQIGGIETTSSRQVGQNSKGSSRDSEKSYGNDESIEQHSSTSGEDRHVELEGQSKTICNSNGDNTRGDSDDSRSVQPSKDNSKIKASGWDMEM